MSDLVIGYKNLIPAATVTADGEASGFPAANVQADDPALPWHSTDLTAYLQADFGVAPTEDVKIVAAIGTNLTTNATRRVRVDNDSAMGSPAHDSTSGDAFDDSLPNLLDWKPPFGRDVVYLPGSDIGSERYMRMDLVDAGNPDGYVRVGVWWAGPIWSSVKSYELEYQTDDDYVDGRVRRTVTVTFRWLTESEGTSLYNVLRELAGIGRLYVVVRKDDPETWLAEAMLCYVPDAPQRTVVRRGETVYNQITIRFVEADW